MIDVIHYPGTPIGNLKAEVERLRAEKALWQNHDVALQAEVERLRAAFDHQHGLLKLAEAEVERLRKEEALLVEVFERVLEGAILIGKNEMEVAHAAIAKVKA
jgi:hypothetical protein